MSRLQDIAGCRIVVDDIADQDRVVGLVVHAFPKAIVIDRREKHSHGYRAMHVVVDINGRLVEIQIRTELQHLWAVLSETLADELDQSIKYGGGSKEIQQILSLESEIVALLESREQMLAAGLKTLDRGQPRSLRDIWSGKSLSLEVFAAMQLVGGMQDLIRREQEVKDSFTRDILELKAKRQNQ